MPRRPFGTVRRLPSGRYQASYHHVATSSRVSAPQTFATASDARTWLATVEADGARGELLDPRLSRRLFNDWAADWLAGLHVKPKTLVGYESALRVHVLPVFGGRPVASITYRDCKGFVDTLLDSGLAPGTVGDARKILRLVLQEAMRADAIRRNPADRLRVPRGRRDEMVFLTADEVLKLAHHVANPPRPARHAQKHWPAYSLLVRLVAFTGLRAGEIASLRVGRVNPLHGRLQVAESVEEVHGQLVYGPPKTYAHRSVPIPAALGAELAEHLAMRPGDPDAFVFSAADGGPLRHSNFYRRYFKPGVHRAGLDPRTRFHDLRHTAAALMIAEGAHLLAVKERLGHSTIQVTADRYGHLFPSLEASLTDRLDRTYAAAVAKHQLRR
jgi:integrase